LGAEVIGVSADSPESHLAFARKFDLPFVLLSDPGNDVRKKLGVPGSLLGLLPGRVTYVVGKGGTVQQVFNSQLNVREHVKVAIEELKEKP
jgi:peroxiredoxin Q/BCP